MELELKHLSTYLPYKLKVLSGDSKVKYLLTDVNLNKKTYQRFVKLHKEDTRYYTQKLEYCKPILRSLSELFYEIEIKGNKFIPVELLDSESYPVDYFDVEMNFYEYLKNWVVSEDKTHHINFLPFGFIQQLLEWHFDIFGLIDAKLAVDMNCLGSMEEYCWY